MFLQRQISASCVEGEVEHLAEGTKFPYKLVDVLPKYILEIGEGAISSDYIRLDATDSYAVPLPESYVSTERLSVVIRSNDICKVVIVSPDHGTSTFLLKGTNGSADGNHLGHIMWQGTVTSITLSVPATFDPALIDYFMFILPDLDEAASYQLGDVALGYTANDL